MLQLLLAFSAGLATIAAPCVLPMAPIVLGASVTQASRSRPLFITLGFAAAFSSTALLLGAFSEAVPVSPGALRDIAACGLAVFGILMLWPSPFHALAQPLGGVLTRVDEFSRRTGSGKWGGFVLGIALGVLWTPCAGPVLGSILTLVATSHDLASAAPLLVCYSLGAGMPMLAIGYGGRYAATSLRRIARHLGAIQRGFGVVVIVLAIAMALDLDSIASAWLSNFLPGVPLSL